MRRALRRGGTNAGRRQSGHAMATVAFSADRGGSIPHNVIAASKTASKDAYARWCRERGLPNPSGTLSG